MGRFKVGDKVLTNFGEIGIITRQSKYNGDCRYHDYLVEIPVNIKDGENTITSIEEGYGDSELQLVKE